jgi:hypothetical protein
LHRIAQHQLLIDPVEIAVIRIVPERAAVVDTQLRMPPFAINPKTDFFAPLRVDLHQVALGVYRYRLEAVVVETRSVGIESKVNFLSAARADLDRAIAFTIPPPRAFSEN